jgi:hypothetical protein
MVALVMGAIALQGFLHPKPVAVSTLLNPPAATQAEAALSGGTAQASPRTPASTF